MGFFNRKDKTESKNDNDKTETKEDEKAEALAAKKRIEAEMAEIQAKTKQNRVQQAKGLIGDDATTVQGRKQGVAQAMDDFLKKGTEAQVNAQPVQDFFEQTAPPAIDSRKQGYAQSIQDFNQKGRTDGATGDDTSSLPTELQATFEQDSNTLPTLFQASTLKSSTPAQATAVEGGEISKSSPLYPKGWDGVTYYSLVDLRQRRIANVDMQNREQYLSPAEFQSAFEMTKEEFAKCPKWKRDKLKRALYLF